VAGQDRTAAWIDGRIADSWPRLARPRSLLVALALLIGLVDGVLALALRDVEPDAAPPLSPADARQILADAAAEPGTWLLIGDSVLAGDVMAGRVTDWQHHRVLDYMRSEQAASEEAGAVRFRQLGLDGLLPADVERIVAELDRRDPDGSVSLAIELNLRHFSRHYAEDTGCTRSWLCELGGADLARWDVTGLAVSPLRWVASELRPWLPIVRHNRDLDLDRALARFGDGVVAPRSDGEQPSRADEGAARIAEHYRVSELAGQSTQIQALDRVLARLRARGRTAVFFTTPLRDTFVAEVASEEEIGGRYAALAERIHDANAPASLVQLDHPLFVEDLFLDHCHLGPAGNQLLALNLLHALDVPLARRPSPLEMIRTEGPHETLVGRVDTGYAEGAGWQALFDHPDGLAVRSEPREVIVADTGNHVLRRLRGALETTELLAGAPGEAGAVDGPGLEARLDGPRQPCVLGDAVYFLDGSQRRLRVLEGGAVRTIDSPAARKATALRCHKKRVWLLDGSELRSYEPRSGKTRSYALATDAQKIRGRTFALADDGRIFVVGANNQIFTGRPGKRGGRLGLDLVFANKGSALVPKERKKKFPYAFDDVRFDTIADIAYVERYGGLLVQVVATPRQPVVGLTENVHLRFLDLAKRKVYPWLKPEVYGQSYLMYNESADTPVSGYHQGSMALDQASASLFYVEHARSRLYRIDDGLLGVTKVSHFGGNPARLPQRDRIGGKLAPFVQARMRPHEHLAARWQRKPRRGPYLGVIIGSSKSAYHDILGEYSIGRRIEHELVSELGYRDRIGFDLYQRTAPGASLAQMAETIAASEEQGLPFDVAFLEIYGLTDRFLRETPTEAEQLARLAELDAVRRATGMLIVFIDTTSLGSRRRDSMRAAPREAVAFMAMARRLGFPVLRPSDRLIREHLDHSAWGNQPWSRKRRQHHGSTWGIDLTGETLASMAYPMIAAYARDALPRHLRDDDRSGADAAGKAASRRLLADVFTTRTIAASALPAIDREAVQVRYERGHLRLFVDRGKPGASGDPEAVVLAVLHAFLVDDVYGALAERVTIDLARFRSYNEYGAGLLDAADIEAQHSFGRDELDAFLAGVLARHPEWASPTQ